MFSITRRGMITCLAVLLLPSLPALAYVTDNTVHTPPSYNTFTPPAMGSSYTDPVFGSTVVRVSDAVQMGAPWIQPEYSTAAAFNQDNSYLLLLANSYFKLLDGQGHFVKNLSQVCASCEPRWSRKVASVLYYHVGNQLHSLDVASGADSVVHSFSEYSSISGHGEMDMSLDGDHMVFAGNNGDIFLYTISSNSKSPVLNAQGNAFDSLYVGANNNVTVTWVASGSGRYQGIEEFDSSMKFIRQLTHAGGHMHMSTDVNGDPVLVWTNSGDPQPTCGQNAIVKVSLTTGQQTCLLSLGWNLAVHISAADSTWAFVETYAPANPDPSSSAWVPYTNEILQIKLDGSEVRRLVHHRSRPFDSYNYEPKTSASRDGSRIVFGSNMDQQSISGMSQLYTDAYVIVLGGPAPTPCRNLHRRQRRRQRPHRRRRPLPLPLCPAAVSPTRPAIRRREHRPIQSARCLAPTWPPARPRPRRCPCRPACWAPPFW